MRYQIALTLCPLLIGLGAASRPTPVLATPPKAASPAAQRLRDQLLQLLHRGELDRAVTLALDAAGKSPDPAIRSEGLSLLNSIARQSIQQDDYATADRTLSAILKVAPDNADALQMTKTITAARGALPARLREAKSWLAVEWYEPAFGVLGQAVALSPNRRAELTPDYLKAAVGAGDDHYFTKNFREAFYCFDAAIQTQIENGIAITPGLAARWLQSMAFALVEDVDRATFTPDFWKVVLRRVAAAPRAQSADAELRAMVRGMAAEDAGEQGPAAREYAFVAGANPAMAGDAGALSDARRAAVSRLRAIYDPSLSDRRAGPWRTRLSGDWRVLKTPGFRIHHRNEHAARGVADALAFHFDRVCQLLGRTREQVPWPVPCDIWLYSDRAHFVREVGPKSDAVLASSDIRLLGTKLESHAVHVTQSDPMLLSSTLAHELTHLIVGAATEYRTLPGAIAEGIALAVEPRARHVQFARIHRGLARRRDAAALLQFNETHPADAAFYAEAANLVARLSARGGIAPILSLPDRPTPDNVAAAYRLNGVRELDHLIAAPADRTERRTHRD